ncbi:hypothetical protein B0H16DRAFT_1476791 [Mycena metata]|uniref:Uncharacterized protein n=1 Tax=Mycena metata TaxID=1033252 RepID=A0AAD7HAM5_9AGAR|nr:hypothetical protein B0H16DRAFT_1476791 [Mycena metata]
MAAPTEQVDMSFSNAGGSFSTIRRGWPMCRGSNCVSKFCAAATSSFDACECALRAGSTPIIKRILICADDPKDLDCFDFAPEEKTKYKMPDACTQTEPDLMTETDRQFKREAIDWVEGKLVGDPSPEMLRWLGVNLVAAPQNTKPTDAALAVEKQAQELARRRNAAIEEIDRLREATEYRRNKPWLIPPPGWKGPLATTGLDAKTRARIEEINKSRHTEDATLLVKSCRGSLDRWTRRGFSRRRRRRWRVVTAGDDRFWRGRPQALLVGGPAKVILDTQKEIMWRYSYAHVVLKDIVTTFDHEVNRCDLTKLARSLLVEVGEAEGEPLGENLRLWGRVCRKVGVVIVWWQFAFIVVSVVVFKDSSTETKFRGRYMNKMSDVPIKRHNPARGHEPRLTGLVIFRKVVDARGGTTAAFCRTFGHRRRRVKVVCSCITHTAKASTFLIRLQFDLHHAALP